ncbi:MAG: YqgE/AlgH family protein [Akkermansiaceae bacterium]
MDFNEPSPHSLKNHLLISDPTLQGGIFHRSVIFLVEHDDQNGALGFILNRPSGQLVGDFLKGEEFAPISHVQVHVGGPVSQDHMTFAAFWEEDGRLQYTSRISAEDAVEESHRPGRLVKAFVGYSGWDAGQLEGELESQSWFTDSISPGLLGKTHDSRLWQRLLSEMSPYHQLLAKAPENILAN